jgi:hypothetical protein
VSVWVGWLMGGWVIGRLVGVSKSANQQTESTKQPTNQSPNQPTQPNPTQPNHSKAGSTHLSIDAEVLVGVVPGEHASEEDRHDARQLDRLFTSNGGEKEGKGREKGHVSVRVSKQATLENTDREAPSTPPIHHHIQSLL